MAIVNLSNPCMARVSSELRQMNAGGRKILKNGGRLIGSSPTVKLKVLKR